mmetsp:Transcript_52130/g.174024  ORF Transcript_52130/g.174024 Transcript_52130/m.174024 type:complete len:260 (-) Transcript_52130:242-1021(-)
MQRKQWTHHGGRKGPAPSPERCPSPAVGGRGVSEAPPVGRPRGACHPGEGRKGERRVVCSRRLELGGLPAERFDRLLERLEELERLLRREGDGRGAVEARQQRALLVRHLADERAPGEGGCDGGLARAAAVRLLLLRPLSPPPTPCRSAASRAPHRLRLVMVLHHGAHELQLVEQRLEPAGRRDGKTHLWRAAAALRRRRESGDLLACEADRPRAVALLEAEGAHCARRGALVRESGDQVLVRPLERARRRTAQQLRPP